MTYVDGFVAAVPTANREAYKKHAEAAAIVFKEYGALKFVECWGDDVPDGEVTSFPMAVSAGMMRLWSSPGSSGLHAQSAIEAWKRSWPTHAYNLLRTRCPLTENA
jgi:hypothetical protein